MAEQARLDVWTYASANSITTPGNLTGTYWPGMKVALKQGTIKYFVIESVTYAAPNTTIVLDGLGTYSLTSAAITAHIDVSDVPKGFPYPNLATQIKTAIKAYCDTLYAIRAGLAGGQTLIGDTASGGNLTLQSTAHATRGYVKIADACEFLSYSNFLRQDGALLGIGAYYSGGWKRTTANQAGAVIRNTSGRMEIWTGAAETAAADTTITGFSARVIFWPTGGVSVGSGTDPGTTNLLIGGSLYTQNIYQTHNTALRHYNAAGTAFAAFITSSDDHLYISSDGDHIFRVGATSYSQKMRLYESGGLLLGSGSDPGAGNFYAAGDVSAATFTDRTKAFVGDALAEIAKIAQNHKGEIDHATLPRFIQIEKRDKEGKTVIERDLGGSISMLFTAVQQLMKENEDLKARIKVLEG